MSYVTNLKTLPHFGTVIATVVSKRGDFAGLLFFEFT